MALGMIHVNAERVTISIAPGLTSATHAIPRHFRVDLVGCIAASASANGGVIPSSKWRKAGVATDVHLVPYCHLVDIID